MTLVADHVTGKTTTFKRRRWIDRELGGQEGVLEGGDFKVTQRAAGGANMSVDIAPGDAFVDIDSGTKSGRAHVDSDAIENRAVAASHATLPRIDFVVLDYNDTSIPAGSGGGDAPTLRVLTGTPTASVTQDAPGASPPALPADALLLATILVPAASTSVTTGNIRDRRKAARGINARFLKRSATDYSTASTGYVGVDDANMALRCELGANSTIDVTLKGFADNSGQLTLALFGAPGGNALVEQYVDTSATHSGGSGDLFSWRGALADLGLAAGSQVLRPAWRVAAGTGKLYTADNGAPVAGRHVIWSIEEDVRPTFSNT